MRFAAQRFDHLGRRMQVMEKLSSEYWDAYLKLGRPRKVGRLRNYWGNISNWLREMAEELTVLKEVTGECGWLRTVPTGWRACSHDTTARFSRGLTESKSLEEAVRAYNSTSICPDRKSLDLDQDHSRLHLQHRDKTHSLECAA